VSTKNPSPNCISLDRASLRYWLVKRDLTQRALSLKIGVAEGQLASLIHRDRLPAEMAKSIARVLRIDLAQLTDAGDEVQS
jgi:Helix-turn-helix